MHSEDEVEVELDPVEPVLVVPGFWEAYELVEEVPVELLLCGAGGATLGGGAGAGAACAFCSPLATLLRNESAVKAVGICEAMDDMTVSV